MTSSPKSIDSLSRIQSLRCAICLSTLTEPKLLDCAHTFCLPCLTKLLRKKVIKCPLCRASTSVLDGDVTKLKTNITVKSVVEDVAQLKRKCDTCGSLKTRTNLSFCSTCRKAMCVQCTEKHDKDERNSDHNVGHMNRDISIATSNPPRCANHESVFCISVCIECSLYLCENCIQDHIEKDHRVESNTEYVSELFARATKLQEDCKDVSNKCRTNTISVMKNEQITKLCIEKLKKAIHVECEIALANVKDRETSLTKFCNDLENEAMEITTEMDRDTLETLSIVKNVRASTDSLLRSPFACISSNESHFEKNGGKIGKQKARADEILKLSEQVRGIAENLHFVKSHHNADIPVGSLEKHTWERIDIELRSDKMTDTAVSPDGKVAVGYFDGGIELINKSNSEKIILKHVKVMALAWFPNGDLAVRDTDNCLLVYDTDLKRSNVSFKTLGHYEGGDGGIVVNSESEILMSYRHVFQIHFFRKKGGKAFRVIDCVNYVPQQLIVPTVNSDILVMDASVMRIIDKQGNTKSQVNQPGCFGYPAVLDDRSIIIAWVNEDETFVRIEQYTYELRSKNKILEASLGRTTRKWYKLLAISCNMIYFCSPNTMHYFRLHKTTVGDKRYIWL